MTDTPKDDQLIPETQLTAEDARRADARVRMALIASLVVVLVAAIAAVRLVWWPRPAQTPGPAPAPVAGPGSTKAPPTGAVVKIPFADVGPKSGVVFDRENGAYGEKLLPETMGGGVAILDFDGDGKQDLLFVNGMPWPWTPNQPNITPTAKLFLNMGGGEFIEVTNRSGLDVPMQGMGVAVGDYDGDGRPDVYVTAVGQDRLFRNVTERAPAIRFEDVTFAAGIPKEDQWGSSAGFIDYDRDGDLDLFVCNYVEWSPDIDRKVGYQLTGVGRAYGPPDGFAGATCKLYRNKGDGTFEDVTDAAGIAVKNPATKQPMAKALGVSFVDVDRDGWVDILVANDKVANCFFHNKGDGTFEEIGAASGIAFDRNGAATGAMGIDSSWFRNDGRLGVAIGNFANEMSSLYVADAGSTHFSDDAIPEGIGPATRKVLSFGTLFFDADLDGWEDFLQTNGHLEEDIHRVYRSQEYMQRGQLFRNVAGIAPDGPAFVELPPASVADIARPIVGRGSAFGDLDQDGDLDLVLMQPKGQPLVLRNENASRPNWVRLKLVGAAKNRDAIGAEIDLVAGDLVQRKMVMPTRSYLSQSELPVTFGLGDRKAVDKVRIRWPDGTEQIVDGDKIALRAVTRIEQAAAK
ncbi:MAG: CRTAC1 family protein [Phycisphaerales bacterium]